MIRPQHAPTGPGTLGILALCLAVILPIGCGGSGSRSQQVHASDLVEVRRYTFDQGLTDPQPCWSPVDDRIAVRIANGFAVLDEGRKGQEFFSAQGAKDRQYPVWLDGQRVVMGSSANAIRLVDGRVVPPGQGLDLVDLTKPADDNRIELDGWGFRPRVGLPTGWGGERRIVTQVGERIRLVDPNAAAGERGRDFADGFYAEPQWDGPGMAWTETPIIEPDLWTGRSGRGNLVVRWRPGQADTYPACLEPRWLPGGRGLLATRLTADPPAQGAWFQGGTEVVFIRGPGAQPQVVVAAARAPAPHPTLPIVAVGLTGGGVGLVDLSGGTPMRVADGGQPAWNTIGDRLLVVEPVVSQGKVLRSTLVVVVMAVKPRN